LWVDFAIFASVAVFAVAVAVHMEVRHMVELRHYACAKAAVAKAVGTKVVEDAKVAEGGSHSVCTCSSSR